MGYLQVVMTIARKDLAMELRGKESLTTILMFALITLIIFHFAIDASQKGMREMAAGVLWVAFLFSSAISMNRSFLHEKEEGRLSALMLAPIDRSAIFFGKMAASYLITLLAMAIITPVFVVLFNTAVMVDPFWQTITFLLGGLGFVTVGQLVAAISVNLRAREMMTPLLMLPVVAPVLIAAVELSSGIITEEPIGSLEIWLKTLAVFDVVYLVVAWLLFDKIIEE